jgi:hypothetical protein
MIIQTFYGMVGIGYPTYGTPPSTLYMPSLAIMAYDGDRIIDHLNHKDHDTMIIQMTSVGK